MLDDARFPIALSVAKDGDARFMGQLDFARLVDRSLRRSGLPVLYTRGFNPRIRLAFAEALPLGVASTGEWVGLILTEDLAPESIRAALEPALPESVRLVDVRRGDPPAPPSVVRYRLELRAGARSAADALTELLTRDVFHVEDRRRERTADVRAMLRGGRLEEDGTGSRLLLELVAVDGRPPRTALLAEALAQLAAEAGAEPPVFGVSTKLAAAERRQGAEAWRDAAGGIPEEAAASCSSTPASRTRAG